MKNNNIATSLEAEIKNVSFKRPHVVILGAGASVAALPNGDKNGKLLPVMDDFLEKIDLNDIVSNLDLNSSDGNFEEIYSDLHSSGNIDITNEIERRVFDYFSNLKLPIKPTIYDHLVLSLRPKDVIATFNWDPFLWQACERNLYLTKPPEIIFLHGNVAVGVCFESKTIGLLGRTCKASGKKFEKTSLLFPIKQKNYAENEYIKTSWETLKKYLKNAYIVTIFGYGAPKSDVEAIELMKQAWGSSEDRNLEEIEIIDLKDDDELAETWEDFIHSHHYRVCSNFYDSWIANHPRRSCEAMWDMLMQCNFCDDNPIPQYNNFENLWEWYKEFLYYEERG
tara:strand:+ start:4254 stop:5267 length:1014 start_codon:yes stop_codon:yes gene_type:complete